MNSGRNNLLLESPSVSSAANLRTAIDDSLRAHNGVSISELQKSFTIVTDGAAVIAKVAGSSVSRTRSSTDHKWMRCMVHVLNNVVKYSLVQKSLGPSAIF